MITLTFQPNPSNKLCYVFTLRSSGWARSESIYTAFVLLYSLKLSSFQIKFSSTAAVRQHLIFHPQTSRCTHSSFQFVWATPHCSPPFALTFHKNSSFCMQYNWINSIIFCKTFSRSSVIPFFPNLINQFLKALRILRFKRVPTSQQHSTKQIYKYYVSTAAYQNEKVVNCYDKYYKHIATILANAHFATLIDAYTFTSLSVQDPLFAPFLQRLYLSGRFISASIFEKYKDTKSKQDGSSGPVELGMKCGETRRAC